MRDDRAIEITDHVEIGVPSLRLSARMWDALCRDVLA